MNWTHLMFWKQKAKDKKRKFLAVRISRSLYLFARKNSIHERLDWPVLLKPCCSYLSTWGKIQYTNSVSMNTSGIVSTKPFIYSHAPQYKWHRYKIYFRSLKGFPVNIGKGPWLLCMWHMHKRISHPQSYDYAYLWFHLVN